MLLFVGAIVGKLVVHRYSQLIRSNRDLARHIYWMRSYDYALSDLLLAPVLGGYNITVVTVPSKGPFRLRTSVTLSCQVNPQPSGRVTFSWKSSNQYSGLPSGNSTSPNTTLYIYYNYLHLSWYFCYAYSDGTLVGVGRTLVETEGQFYIIRLWCYLLFTIATSTSPFRVCQY